MDRVWEPSFGGLLALPPAASATWLLMAGAAGVGIVKCGLTGLAPVTTYIFTVYAPGGPKAGLGLMQPVLIIGDLSVAFTHGGLAKPADRALIIELLIWTAVGLVFGYALLGAVSDTLVRRLLGIAIFITAWRRWIGKASASNGADTPSDSTLKEKTVSGSRWSCVADVRRAALGILCGVVSVLTNNSGLLLDAYLLGLQLPKSRFLVVRSSYLLLAGIMKLFGHLALRMLPLVAIPFAGWLCILTVAGVMVGKSVVRLLPQWAFDIVVWSFVILGATRLTVWG